MSIEALRWALDIGEELELEPARRLVLIMLGNSADQAGGNLFPSYGYLCRRTGMGKSTIRAHIAALVKAEILLTLPRSREDGGQTSNGYRLSMRQPGLQLNDDMVSRRPVTPPPDSGAPLSESSTPPAGRQAGGTPYIKDLKQELSGRRGAPSPVAQAFKAYQDGIKAKYNAEYPPSAKANGQLSNVVSRVGRERVVAVVAWYLASADPFYGKTKHALDYLVRDCEKFSLELQAASSGKPAAPVTHARVALLKEDGTVARELDQVPAGDMLAIAKTTAQSYSGMISRLKPKYIAVRQGADRRQFSVEELACR